MAKRSSERVALGALALGLGALVAVAVSGGGSADRRSTFIANLRERLRLRGIELISAELGRIVEKQAWVLTLQLPNQHVTTVHAPVDPPRDPLADDVCEEIATRVVQHFL